MKKHNLSKNLSRFLLWLHVISVVGFYIVLWLRSTPSKQGRVKKSASRPESYKQSASYPLVSIIVPARNEELNIRRCVESLLEQSYPNYEVIVVDDGSTDDTPNILETLIQTHRQSNRLWVLRLREELPEGWAGKPHAIHAGVQESHGEWLLFTDADTWHAPDALQCALTSALKTGSDLYTLGTQQELPGFWDKVMMPMAYLGISMMYPVKKVNDPLSSIAIANGQFILIRRAVYDILGGYARPELRNTLLDDRDLAYTVKQQGFRLKLEDGRDLVHVQMYHGLREAWRGWRKNAFLGSRGGVAFVIIQLIGLPMVAIAPFLLPLAALVSRRKLVRGRVVSSSEIGAAALFELGPILSYHISIDKELKVPWYYAFAYPLAASLFECILAQSAWRVLRRKGIDWRGRQYYK
ncbi:MAG TPA: glycosyltransferase family 2 protein [Ktedonobacteraceae bacterium]|nr:glycosyltransferase family 2 protein [Ktedonobacteraceae bacterium]